MFLVVAGVKCKRWCFSAEPPWTFQRCGPAGPRSSSGGHQQRSCWDQRQVWNSPGKLPDSLTKGRVCFLWEEEEGVRKGYPWVEEPRWAGGLINLLKKIKSSRGDSAGPWMPLRHRRRRLRNRRICVPRQNRTDGWEMRRQRCLYSAASYSQTEA